MGEMADYINIAILGTVDARTGEVDFFGTPVEANIKRMQMTCRRRNIPQPEVFDSEFGYKRTRCACGLDFAIRGYIKHYVRAHTEKIPKKIIIEEIEESGAFDPAAPAFDEKSWRVRAKANHEKILKRFAITGR